MIFLAAGLILHFLAPGLHVFNVASLPVKILGVVLFVLGMGLSMQGSKQFAENQTEILPTSPTNRVLVTDGVYKFSRNPMYLGMIVSLLGIGLFAGTLPVLLVPLAQFLVLNFVFIPFEEQKLTNIFGQSYLDYGNRVRRWI